MKQVAAILFLSLAACSQFQSKQPDNTLALSGRIEGDEIDLGFKAGGKIADILVREGDHVQAGQVVARLAGEQERIRLQEAEARLAGASARVNQARLQIPTLEQRLETSRLTEEQAQQDAPSRVAQAEAQAEAARADLERAQADTAQLAADAARYKELADKGAAPQQQAEQYASRLRASQAAVEALRKQVSAAESAVSAAKATLKVPQIRAAEGKTLNRQIDEAHAAVRLAESDVAVAQAAVAGARQAVEDLEIKAPVDGTIITRAAEPGRVVPAGTTVLTMVDLSKLYLRGFVPEGEIGRVKIGQKAQVFLDSAPDTPLSAEVMRIDPQAMFTPENTYFKEDRVKQVVGVKVALLNETGAAKPGMPADGVIRVQ